jgi:hypothetical protein
MFFQRSIDQLAVRAATKALMVKWQTYRKYLINLPCQTKVFTVYAI